MRSARSASLRHRPRSFRRAGCTRPSPKDATTLHRARDGRALLVAELHRDALELDEGPPRSAERRPRSGASLEGELSDGVATSHAAGLDDSCVHTAQAQRPASWRVHEAGRVRAEARRELRAPRVRHVGHLDDRRAECEPRSRRKVLRPQVEVDVELVPRESPPFPIGRQQRDHARVHERELRARVRGLAVLPSARPPAVSDQALVEIELAFLENLSLALRRPANDQLDGSLGSRRPLDVRQAGLELRRRTCTSLVIWPVR